MCVCVYASLRIFILFHGRTSHTAYTVHTRTTNIFRAITHFSFMSKEEKIDVSCVIHSEARHDNRTEESGRENGNNRIFFLAEQLGQHWLSSCQCGRLCVWETNACTAKRQKRSDWGWTTQFVYFTRVYKKKLRSTRGREKYPYETMKSPGIGLRHTSRHRAQQKREKTRGRWKDTSTGIGETKQKKNKSSTRIKMHANIRRCISTSFYF